MNKFKAWLIHKLGGFAYLSEQPIVFKCSERPIITLNFDTVLPPSEWDKVMSENRIELAHREAAERIGRYIIDNGLYEITRNYDIEIKREKVRYKIRVVQPQNAPQLSNKYGNIDEVHNDPTAYKEALKFYGLDGD